MPAYSYHAINPLGRNVQGVIEAESERSARSQLRQQSLVTVKLFVLTQTPATHKGDLVIWHARVFSHGSLAVWTRQLASLVNAGLPLERALSALLEQADTPAQRELQAQQKDAPLKLKVPAPFLVKPTEPPTAFASTTDDPDATSTDALVRFRVAPLNVQAPHVPEEPKAKPATD